MSNLEAMVTAVNFIEAHLQENIKVADMADAVAYSLFHFCRTFNKVVHHSPYDYLMRRRLSESARLLIETDHRITDIAFAFQFNSPETYSRAFRRLFGQLPRAWKKGVMRHAYRIMPRLTPAHLVQRNQSDFVRYKPIQQERLSLMGLMSLITDKEQDSISHLWTNLAVTLNHTQPFVNAPFYGLHWLTESEAKPANFYMAAVRSVTETGGMDALVTKIIPGGVYGRFTCPGTFKTRQLLLDYILHTWLPQSKMMLAHPFLIEHYQNPPDKAESSCWDIAVPVQNVMIGRR